MCAIGKEDLAPLLSTSGGVTGHTNTKFKHINVLVTAGSLIPSLAKCLLFRLDNLIRHENGLLSFLSLNYIINCIFFVKQFFFTNLGVLPFFMHNIIVQKEH